MNYHVFCLYNNVDILNNNTKFSLDTIRDNEKVNYYYFNNENNRYTYIREWINECLEEIYFKKKEFQNSYIAFIHQDVLFDRDLFCKLNRYVSEKPNEAAVLGFAGIDSKSKTHNFMKDSKYFVFSGTDTMVEVESVDEYFFLLNADILISEEIYLSKISSWHAYAVEFSIMFRNLNYKTFYVPLYTFHNSKRSNNEGLYKTHKELYNIYNSTCYSLCGNVENESFRRRVKQKLYALYVNNIKFNNKLTFVDLSKFFFLDVLGLKLNMSRYIYYFKYSRKIINYYFISQKLFDENVVVEFDNGRVLYFKTIEKFEPNIINSDKNEITYVNGYKMKMKESCYYYEKYDINVFY